MWLRKQNDLDKVKGLDSHLQSVIKRTANLKTKNPIETRMPVDN